MFLRKVWFFTLLSTIVGLAAVGRLNRRIDQLDPTQLSSRRQSPGLAAEGSIWCGSHKALRAKNEMRSTLFLPVQFNNSRGLGAGKLLVASRDLADPNFAETVILLVRYDEQGVVGLVLNRRTDVPLSEVFKGMKSAEKRSDPVYLGGPVETPAVFSLLKSSSKIEGAEQIFREVYLISSKTLFEQTISTRPESGVFHVYLGYAGWHTDQLRKEVELGAWFILPADANTVFNSDPDSLWSQMIRKTELKFVRGRPADTEPRRVPINELFDL
jgi:putative transcriptional regulator